MLNSVAAAGQFAAELNLTRMAGEIMYDDLHVRNPDLKNYEQVMA